MSQLDNLIKEFNRQYKEPIIHMGLMATISEKIPFTSARANYMLYGGLPRGKIIEFAGEENGGKTTTALDIVANAQKIFKREYEDEINKLESIEKPTKDEMKRLQTLKLRNRPQMVVYSDNENTLDDDWAKKIGVDIDNMIILKPQSQTAEQIFEMLLELIRSDEVGLVVIDSLGVMLSAQAYEKTMEEKTYGGIAAALTLFSKKAELLCYKHNCTLIGINQMREDLNSRFGGTTTTGGKGWKHNCAVRLMFSKGDYIDEDGGKLTRSVEDPAGNKVMISIAKTKVCKPDRRTGFYTLNYDYGIDGISDLIEVAIRSGHIRQSGSWFELIDIENGEIMTDEDGEIIKLQGKAKVKDYISENEIIHDELIQALEPFILGLDK